MKYIRLGLIGMATFIIGLAFRVTYFYFDGYRISYEKIDRQYPDLIDVIGSVTYGPIIENFALIVLPFYFLQKLKLKINYTISLLFCLILAFFLHGSGVDGFRAAISFFIFHLIFYLGLGSWKTRGGYIDSVVVHSSANFSALMYNIIFKYDFLFYSI